MGLSRVTVWSKTTPEGAIYDFPRSLGVHPSMNIAFMTPVPGRSGVLVSEASHLVCQDSRVDRLCADKWMMGLWYVTDRGRVLVATQADLRLWSQAQPGLPVAAWSPEEVYVAGWVDYNRYVLKRIRLQWVWRPTQAADWYIVPTPDGYERRAVDGTWMSGTTPQDAWSNGPTSTARRPATAMTPKADSPASIGPTGGSRNGPPTPGV
jgi:hypothetical protein